MQDSVCLFFFFLELLRSPLSESVRTTCESAHTLASVRMSFLYSKNKNKTKTQTYDTELQSEMEFLFFLFFQVIKLRQGRLGGGGA